MSDETRIKSTLFIGNLAPAVTSTTLHGAFIPFGEITDISLPKPDPRNRSERSEQTQHTQSDQAEGAGMMPPPATHKGFGYIEFSSPQDAEDALDNMDQSELFGRTITVNKARGNQLKKEGAEGVLGSRSALWEQEGYLAANGGGGESDRGKEGGREEQSVGEGLRGLDVAGPRVREGVAV